ncbi:MAG: alpha/beta hydrolase [Microthrixaceae bacterium]
MSHSGGLDPELVPIVELVGAATPGDPAELGVERMRADYAGFAATVGDGPAVGSEEDVAVAGPAGPVAVRLYRPAEPASAPPGLVVFLHGGGFTIGDLDTHAAACRRLCAGSGAVVASVDYRLAPEAPYPAAADDSWAALVELVARAAELGVDSRRVAVAGDSAGGNLAAVLALRARDAGGPALRLQALVYPVCDLVHDAARFPSLRTNGEGYLLTAATMRFFADQYVPDPERRREPGASPLRVEDLSGVAPALVVVAGFDPLRDEGEAYAAALAAAGVEVRLERFDGAVHLTYQLAEVTGVGARMADTVVDAVRRALS